MVEKGEQKMHKIVDYAIVVRAMSDFKKEIDKHIKAGYQPVGDITNFRTLDLYMQLMVKYAEEEEKEDGSGLILDKLKKAAAYQAHRNAFRKELFKELFKNKEESKNGVQAEEPPFKFKVGQKVKFTSESLKDPYNAIFSDKIYIIHSKEYNSRKDYNIYHLSRELGNPELCAVGWEHELELVEDHEEIKVGDWVEYESNKYHVKKIYMCESGYARVVFYNHIISPLLHECKKTQPPEEEIKVGKTFKKGDKVWVEAVVEGGENTDEIFITLAVRGANSLLTEWVIRVHKSNLIKKV